MRRGIRLALWIVGGLLAIATLTVGGYIIANVTYFDRDMAAVRRAGFVEKQVTVNGSEMNYAEGPDKGPALLLIHGQATDWKNYAKVLPGLATRYRVFAVDCYGHGSSARTPEKYSTVAMGADLARFIAEIIGEPVVVSGHSSGGLLAVWLAANMPDLVRGVVLEDPPLFTTLLPRARKTWNYVDLATTAHNFLASGEKDFVAYDVAHGKLFALFKELQPRMVSSVREHRARHPGKPVRIFYMPPAMNEFFRGLDTYDPRFGDRFYDGSWDDGFDHADALARITIPAVLIHTNWSYDADGILMAAMDDKDAARARSLIKGVQFIQVDSGHGFHLEKPRDFVRIMVSFKDRISNQ